MTSQRFCLRWNNHQSNLLTVFDQLLHDESFVDVTIAVDGQLLRAHKMVLSACSPYFQALFVNHPEKHPIVILKDVPFCDMRSLLDFMYRGEVSVDQDRLTAFLKVAESLRIKGLTEVNEERCDIPSIASSLLEASTSTPQQPPPPNLHRIQIAAAKRSAEAQLPGGRSVSPAGHPRKRGRPRKPSGASDATSPDPISTDSEARNSDSAYAQGPPDLLEMNMTEQDNASDLEPMDSPEAEDNEEFTDGIIKLEPKLEYGDESPNQDDTDDNPAPNDDNSISKTQSQTTNNQSDRFTPDVPMLRLVPKSELMEALRRNSSPTSSMLTDSKSPENETNNNFLMSSASPHFMLHLLGGNMGGGAGGGGGDGGGGGGGGSSSSSEQYSSPSSHSSSFSLQISESFSCGSPTPMKPAVRRRVRRRTASSSDPAEQLTEMSVRGLNLFRYACIDEGVYKCLECAKTDIVKTFKNKYSFQRHAFLYHEGCQRKVFPCPVCSKEFSRPDKMKNHMKTVHDCFMPKDCVVPKDLFPPPPPIPFFLSPP